MAAAWRVLRHTDDMMLRKMYCCPRPADLVAGRGVRLHRGSAPDTPQRDDPLKNKRWLTLCALTGIAATSIGSVLWLPITTQPVGPCLWTEVSWVGTRLTAHGEPIPYSGTALTFTTGLYLVSYDTVVEAENQQPGDRVQICVVSRPRDCPPGDRRGSVFRVHDPERGTTFVMADAQHECGGA